MNTEDREWAKLAKDTAKRAKWATVPCRTCGAAVQHPCKMARARVPSTFGHVARYADVGIVAGDWITLEAAHELLPVGSVIVFVHELECIAVEGTSLHAWRSWQGTSSIGGGADAMVKRVGPLGLPQVVRALLASWDRDDLSLAPGAWDEAMAALRAAVAR